jgi:hypothetical protein
MGARGCDPSALICQTCGTITKYDERCGCQYGPCGPAAHFSARRTPADKVTGRQSTDGALDRHCELLPTSINFMSNRTNYYDEAASTTSVQHQPRRKLCQFSVKPGTRWANHVANVEKRRCCASIELRGEPLGSAPWKPLVRAPFHRPLQQYAATHLVPVKVILAAQCPASTMMSLTRTGAFGANYCQPLPVLLPL